MLTQIWLKMINPAKLVLTLFLKNIGKERKKMISSEDPTNLKRVSRLVWFKGGVLLGK